MICLAPKKTGAFTAQYPNQLFSPTLILSFSLFPHNCILISHVIIGFVTLCHVTCISHITCSFTMCLSLIKTTHHATIFQHLFLYFNLFCNIFLYFSILYFFNINLKSENKNKAWLVASHVIKM